MEKFQDDRTTMLYFYLQVSCIHVSTSIYGAIFHFSSLVLFVTAVNLRARRLSILDPSVSTPLAFSVCLRGFSLGSPENFPLFEM